MSGSSRITYHPENHQFPYAPNFTDVALSNDQPIIDALNIVFKARKRTIGEDKKKRMVSTVENFAGDTRVGSLRQLENDKWKDLKLPVMARIYLKHLINQSVSLTALELLECDFNGGNAIQWDKYEGSLEQVVNMGFQRTQALESLVVCQGELQEALNFLLLPDASKKNERDRAKRLRNNYCAPTSHHTVLAADRAAQAELDKYNNKTGRELKEEIERIRAEVEEARQKNKQLEQIIEDKRRAHQQNLYREYLRGLLCDETIGADELQNLTKYQKNRGISDEQHKTVLAELGYSLDDFESLKDFKTQQYSDECVVCFDPPRDHVILPCLHCCLCESCAEDFMEPGLECPQCRAKIEDIRKVFF